MLLEVPDHLYETFLTFLDVSQAHYTEEDIQNMTELEKQVIIWIENLLGDSRSVRHKSQKEIKEAEEQLRNILKQR